MYNDFISRKYKNKIFHVERLGMKVNEIPNQEPNTKVYKRWDLVDRFSYLAKKHLTWKQYKIFELMLEGKNQSSINKSIFGNQVVGGKHNGKRYGGIIPKLKKYCSKDKIFIKLYKESYGGEI